MFYTGTWSVYSLYPRTQSSARINPLEKELVADAGDSQQRTQDLHYRGGRKHRTPGFSAKQIKVTHTAKYWSTNVNQ